MIHDGRVEWTSILGDRYPDFLTEVPAYALLATVFDQTSDEQIDVVNAFSNLRLNRTNLKHLTSRGILALWKSGTLISTLYKTRMSNIASDLKNRSLKACTLNKELDALLLMNKNLGVRFTMCALEKNYPRGMKSSIVEADVKSRILTAFGRDSIIINSADDERNQRISLKSDADFFSAGHVL